MADVAPPIKFKALIRPGTFAKGTWTPAAWKDVLEDPSNKKEARTYQVRSAVVFPIHMFLFTKMGPLHN